MSMYRHHSHEVPGLNTSSLPDLIFTVLFFFMIVTHMRKANVMVKYKVPAGTELTRLTRHSNTNYLYIGKPMAPGNGNDSQIQLNDKIVTIPEMENYLSRQQKSAGDEDRDNMEVSIKADRYTKMGIITDIKQSLRKANVLKINYSGVSANNKSNTK